MQYFYTYLSVPLGQNVPKLGQYFSRQKQLKLVTDLTANSVSSSQIESISGYLENWDEVSFDDKRRVVDTLISKIEVTSTERVIHWKI